MTKTSPNWNVIAFDSWARNKLNRVMTPSDAVRRGRAARWVQALAQVGYPYLDFAGEILSFEWAMSNLKTHQIDQSDALKLLPKPS